MIGAGATLFSGQSAQDLRQALEARQTQRVSGQPFPRLNLLTAWLMRYALRTAGWIVGNPAPDRPLAWVRL